MNAINTVSRGSLVNDIGALRRGKVSLARSIEELERRFAAVETAVQAYLPERDRFGRMRREAADLEARFSAPDGRPPLYGVMLGVKDIFHVDGFLTRAGAAVPPELFAGEQAAVVTRLREAGALIAGKTVTTEFAYFEPGPTRNPHNLAHSPGGSSSGSAAAVAAGLAQVALGTQTVGSVIRPAAYCGIVGFKPSFARVDTAGLVMFSESADHVGFFTCTVPDMLAVAAVAIDDWRDGPAPQAPPILAVPEGSYLEQCTALDEFEAQLRVLIASGYSVKRIKILDDIEDIGRCHQDLIAAELAIQHQAWFAQHAALYRPRTAELIRHGQAVSRARLLEARQHRFATRARLHSVMSDYGIDLWVCPAAPDVAPQGLGVTGDPKMNMPWTHAGLPALTLPAGRGKLGLPLGLQLIGSFGDDEALLHWAREIEGDLRRMRAID